MPSHRSTDTSGPGTSSGTGTSSPTSGGATATLAPLQAWEGRLREASGWAASVTTLPPLPEEPSTWSGSLPAVGAAERTFAPSRGRRALPDPITDPDLLRSAVPLPPYSDPVTSGRGEPGRLAAQDERGATRPSGRRRSHAATDALPAVPPREATAPGVGATIPAQTRRGRRAATTGGVSMPVGAVGAVVPSQRSAPRDEPAARPTHPAAAHPAAEVPEPYAPGDTFWTTAGLDARTWEPKDAGAPTARPAADPLAAVDEDALLGTAPLDLPAWFWSQDLDPVDPAATTGRGEPVAPAAAVASDVVSGRSWAIPAPARSFDDVEVEVRSDAPAAVPAGTEPPAFLPARGRSAHRRPTRGRSFVPQAGLVAGLGLATVLAPIAAAHVPLLAPADASTSVPGVDAHLPSPVATAAHALLGNRLAAAAPDDLAGRGRHSVSRAGRPGTRASSTATASGSASATSSASGSVTTTGSASASGSASTSGSPTATGAATATGSPAASASASAAAPPSTVAGAQTSIPGISAAPPVASPSPTSTLTADQQALAALVPGCSGATPDTDGAVNGRLPAADLCPLWQDGEALRSDAAVAFAKLDIAYRARFGEDIQLSASYRPYAEQVRLKQVTPRLAAVPGTSEHGWGLAADLGGGVQNSDEHYDWLMENAPKYGWAHPAWAQRGGGGPYEPWHWEYVAGED